MGNGMNKVLPGLYVGNYRDSKDATQLERFGITHILAIHDAARQLHPDKHYLCILAADTPDQNLSQYFSLCNDFIHAARLRGGNVLIHCLAGMSRSVTVAVAYIMSITNLSWKEALKVVRVGRAVANPNVGFQRQLEDFESSRLQEERRRLKERFPSLALTVTDAEACRANLSNYETLALAREVCEGKCAMGRPCPTGLCRQRSKRTLRRKSSTSSTGSLSSSGRTPPQTPRFLPSAPPSPAMPRSASVVSATARPRSGPAGLLSYTGSAPPSRAVSRVDLSAAVACSSSSSIISSSTTNLLTAGRASLTAAGNNDRRVTGSAPETPNKTPPASPMHTARRTSGRRVVESPAVAPIDAPPDSPKYLAQRGIAESVNRRTTRSPTAAASLESPSNSTPPAAGPSPARQPRSSAPPGRSSIGFPSSVGLLESSSSMGPSNDRQQDPAFAATIIGNKRLLPPVELATPSRRSSSSVQNQSQRCFLSEKTNLASTSSTSNLNRR